MATYGPGIQRPVPVSTASALSLSVLIGLSMFLLDWTSKSLAVQILGESLIPLGVLSFGVVYNDAFAFSSGSGLVHPHTVVLIRLLGVALATFLFLRLHHLSRRVSVGFAFLIAGGAGNTADVLFRDGAVIDFIGTGPFTFLIAGEPLDIHFVFNLADVWAVIGLILLWPLIRQFGNAFNARVQRFERRFLARVKAVFARRLPARIMQ